MSNGYSENRAWSDRFVPILTTIVRDALPILAPPDKIIITEAPLDEDVKRGTDLIVHSDNIRIMCRTRSYRYSQDYGDDFTIRTSTVTGREGELSKIMKGFGQYMLYGFSNEKDTDLCKWFIGDLNAFRIYIARFMRENKGEVPGIPKQNTGTDNTWFRVFKTAEVPDFILKEADTRKQAA